MAEHSPDEIEVRFAENLVKVVLAASEVYKPEAVHLWLLGRNKMLGYRRPIDLIETDPGLVLAHVEAMAEGVTT